MIRCGRCDRHDVWDVDSRLGVSVDAVEGGVINTRRIHRRIDRLSYREGVRIDMLVFGHVRTDVGVVDR